MKTSRSFYKRVLIGILVLYTIIVIYVPIYRHSLPEPEQCALCEDTQRCHAPAIMNLSTGEILEMQVYERNPFRPWDIADNQRTGYFFLANGAGLQGWCDGGIAFHTEIHKSAAMNDWLFCRKCRLRLTVNDRCGFVILDLHCPERIRPYAIARGRDYEINGYSVSIEKGEEPMSLSITTTGHLIET